MRYDRIYFEIKALFSVNDLNTDTDRRTDIQTHIYTYMSECVYADVMFYWQFKCF